jgi:flagellar FliJ protein
VAREIKPGKFEYPLEVVLKVREIKEKKESEEFAKTQRKLLEEQNRTQELKTRQESRQDELKEKMSGKISDFGEILRRHSHLGKLKVDVEKQKENEKKAEEKRDKQRDKLLDAVKDRKIIDKDKEHKKDEHSDLMRQIETKFLDEIGTTRFIRGL